MIFLPVIHVTDMDQAKINADTAFSNGADGIWLINHSVSHLELLDCYSHVREYYSDKWIGLNFLDLSWSEVVDFLPITINGLWTDYSGVDDQFNQDRYQKLFTFYWNLRYHKIKYFGGVAFKYQKPVDHAKATVLAKGLMDVITTSGPGTGQAPTLDKIKIMDKARDYNQSLAVASGLSIENISSFKGIIDYAIVASSISKDFDYLDADKVRAFKNALDN